MACSTEQAIKDPIEHFSQIREIPLSVYNKVELESYGIYRPWECIRTNEKYYVLEDKRSNVFSSINSITGSFYQGVNIGSGPGEVLLPERFILEGEDVTFYDTTMKRYKLVENKDSTLSVEVFKDIGIEAISYPTFHGDKMLTKGWFDDAWLHYYIGKNIIDAIEFPSFPETDGLSGIEKMSVFKNGQQKFSPDGNKAAVTISSGCVLAIYNCTDDGLDEVAMLKYFPPKFVAIDYEYQPLATSQSCKIGFVDVCCTNQFIYALYSGKILGDDLFTSHYGGHVFVYDWEGMPVKHYKLERDLFTIEIDEDDGILYGTGNDPEGCILEYKL